MPALKLPDGPQTPLLLQTLQWLTSPIEFMETCAQRYGDIFTVRIGPVFTPQVFITLPQTQERIEGFITCYKKVGFGKWAVIFKESKELIGYCGIAVEQIDQKDEKELGYRLDSRFWGKGLAT